MDKENSKREVQKLIEKYDDVVKENRVNIYNEEMTKKDFILPLFRNLGWDTENSTEVTAEEKISKKRVDYGFRINGIPKFMLEAKKLKGDIINTKYVEQAIDYSWNKGCTWAVLTNFESIIIFNAEWKGESLWHNRYKTIESKEFLQRFDELWLLSRESFEQNLIDIEAEKVGKKVKRISVDKQLLSDFTRFRELLSKNILKLNQKKSLSELELDESVQRVLDRLIFIRNCEDRELESRILISNYREWSSRGKGQLIRSLRETFLSFDKQYNSKIFAEHLCDDLDIDNDVLQEIIESLYYTKDKSISYDFSAIDADILGSIYEQYLSHILKKTEKRATLTENHVHKKEEGIYYTPTYVVDYIVRNTLGELLKDEKVNIEKIRVLDPACGSGSFLIKAYDILNEYQSKNDTSYHQAELDFKTDTIFTKKTKILQNNIFGVDLDRQAVEIAQLNLLLKIAEKKKRLPLLEENIKCGNSLIDDENTIGDKAFKWKNEFKDIIDNGGFSVVIGNPPYIRPHKIPKIEKEFLWKNTATFRAKSDIYNCFMEKGISLLKQGGYIGFIVPHTWLSLESFYHIRHYILINCKVIKLVQLPKKVFRDATVETCIFIFQKESDSKKRKMNEIIVEKLDEYGNIHPIKRFKQSEIENNYLNIFELYSKIESDTIKKKLNKIQKLEERAFFNYGLKTGDDDKFISMSIKDNNSKKLIRSADISRYNINYKGEYVWYVPDLMKKNKKTARPGEPSRFEQEKIIIARMGKELVATYDNNNYYLKDGMIITLKNKDDSAFYLLGLINSKLLNYYYKNYFITIDVLKNAVLQLPIANATPELKDKVIENVQKMLTLYSRLTAIGDKLTNERARIDKKIKNIDYQIDDLVYTIYEITEDEKEIIEESLK
jgi:type I restriction-modification system DNA methylase subunit